MPLTPAVVLLSGGMDSATAAAVARRDGFSLFALSFNYSQRHSAELVAAKRVAAHLGVQQHVTTAIDLRAFGGSALTSEIAVPKRRGKSPPDGSIPITYVPARNTIFLSFALAWAETLGAFDIFVGANALDYSGYPDCRPDYLTAFETMANLATRAGREGPRPFRIHAPLIAMTKQEIIREGMRLGVDFALTHSCYDPASDGLACGHCDSCSIRLQGFLDAGLVDPLPYSPVTASY